MTQGEKKSWQTVHKPQTLDLLNKNGSIKQSMLSVLTRIEHNIHLYKKNKKMPQKQP